MTQKLVSYLTFILFLIPFALLIVDNNVLFPFITTKALFFRILVSIGLVFALWLYLLNPKTFPKKNYLFLAIVLFFLANIISTILSVNPYRSFWGNAERMEGLWSLFFYLAYFFLLFTLFQFNPQAKKTIFYSILIVTTLISIIEIQQAFSFNQERPSATLGNPTYIGFLNLLAIFLIIYFYFEAKDFQKYLYIFLIFLNLLSLIASQTRGSILGLLVGIIVFLFSYLIFSKIEIKKKLAFIVFAFIFLILFFFFLKTDIALKISGINRISETLQNPVSIFPRLYAWKIFLNAFLKKPVFGWGQETMPIAFFSNFDPQIFNYEQAIFDRPHNKFIEILASTGVVGFLTWLLIFLAFIYYVFKLDLNLYQKSTLLAFIFSYLAQNFSLFDMQASYTLFFFGLALVAPKVEFKEAEDKFIRPYLILISGLFLIMIIIHLQHLYIVRKIITYLRENDVEKAAEGFSRLSDIAGPFLSEEASIVNNYFMSHVKEVQHYQTFLLFYEVVKKAYEKDIKDYKVANAYLSLKSIFINALKKIGQDTSKELYETEKIYNDLISSYPNFSEVYFNYAQFLKNIGQDQKAQDILEMGEKTAQNYPKYYLFESALYLDWQKPDIAYEKLKLALAKNFNFRSDNEYETALRVYLANHDVENSKNIISSWLKVNNSNSAEQKITQILKEYNQSQILKLDKE